MKLWLASIMIVGVVYYSAFNSFPTQNGSIPEILDTFIEKQTPLPRYEEASYSPLGRSPVVDAVLADPFYLPQYTQQIANKIKESTKDYNLSELCSTVFRAGGIPIQFQANKSTFSKSKNVPDYFLATFGPVLGSKLYSYWQTFLEIHFEVESIFSVLSNEEKEWLRQHYEDFFFGKDPKPNEYEFFSTDSKMPLQFFALASRINFAKLADCACRLSTIVDDIYRNAADFGTVVLNKNFLWEEQGITFFISIQDHVVHKQNADFFLDLGGNNTIQTNAGGTEGWRPVALHIDLFGENEFIGNTFTQGSGMLGLGILASFGGNNKFKAKFFSQGSGYFGVGILANYGGLNAFELDFGGQSFATFGAALLWDKKGGNAYIAHQGMAQAASSTLGVAFLVDNEGGNEYVNGIKGQGGKRSGGIGQGGSTGVRYDPWKANPSFYGGVSFLYNGGNKNKYMIPWLGQGSSYFLGLGALYAEGAENEYYADYDAQGQALHLSAGMLFQKGGHNRYNGGWGSLGVAGDRSVGMLINTGGNNYYEGTDQSVGTSRKPRAVGVFIGTRGNNDFIFKKSSNANVQMPSSPLEWSTALFLQLGVGNQYPQNVDQLKRGTNLSWQFDEHGFGEDSDVVGSDIDDLLMAKFHTSSQTAIPFDPIKGWSSNTAFQPLIRLKNLGDVQTLVQRVLSADYDERRRLYESIDLYRFTHPKERIDLSDLLNNPEKIPVDQFNYGILWGILGENNAHFDEILNALDQGQIPSDYARKMGILFLGKFGNQKTVPILHQIMMSDSDEENRAFAARGIIKLSTDLNLIQEALKNDSEKVRYMAAKNLQDSCLPGIFEIIQPLYEDKSFYVRRAAAMTGISLGDKEGITVLLDTLTHETLDTGENYGDNIFSELSKYVCVDFGVNREAWIKWWNEVKDTFQLNLK